MRAWSGDLGVRCSFCHWGPTDKFDDLVFDSDNKQTKKTVRDMYRMMAEINKTFFATRDAKISCYTCHHGTNDPRRLDDILTEALDEGGVAQVETVYRKIRKKYHGLGAYNFGPWAGLNAIAGLLYEREELENAKFINELNLEFKF